MTAEATSEASQIWSQLLLEAQSASEAEPCLASYYHGSVLNHQDLPASLSFHLANKLDSHAVPAMMLREVISAAYCQEPQMISAAVADMKAYFERDPACDQYLMPFLYYKGFQALQSYRVANYLWRSDRRALALYFQNQISQEFGVDIHPAAAIGQGIMIDHATGVVIGETAVIHNNVSMLHSVTLGGSGCQGGKRHPTVCEGVLISAGSKVLGNICIGRQAKIGAGSVVLSSVKAHTTVAGVPAKPVGASSGRPALDMDQQLDDCCE
ncbi:serine O-acetyltransferase [uncultured Pseudoteredinibacter sp.]|uniref:serine O-acetyltransferase n=1 Tax=uncultured Pseudoteredinibacter sp. TaxID=1641701 RepID=UPI00262AFAC7|nr:serine O-acetyltransferase [uncultured Pseudoteredinibacter sp.]